MIENKDDSLQGQTLEGWVMAQCEEWRDHYNENYRDKYEEYYRLWRGQWSGSDSMRNSERSRIVTPALQQAVESSVAEVEEATFGRGKWFDIKDDVQDPDNQDIAFLKSQLYEDMQFARARSSISEVLINAAVFGTGVGEMYLEETTEYVPATQPTPDGQNTAVGVMEKDRFLVKLRPIMPQNFLIDTLATSVQDALGCAIDQFVSLHQVQQDIDAGIYLEKEIETVESETALEPDKELSYGDSDRVRLTRYFGLVPRDLFEEAIKESDSSDPLQEFEYVDLKEDGSKEKPSSYVEAIIVIANETTLLKVEENPYMTKERPVVAFQWDTVPSRFWGRGVCEKGYNAQKALDTEMRARIDALALTVHPMMAVDATRMPRGAKLDIRPGKTILTNGNPAEILQPFNFGKLDQITFAQGTQLQEMVQQATGAVDSASYAGAMQSGGSASGISMSMGAIIKRHKRTLLNFQENFIIPFVTKAAHSYMQFEPELYKAQDHKFVATSSLGIIAREYEVTQLVQLLQTMPQDNPVYPMLIEAVIEHMNISNREQILGKIKEASKPNPEAQAQAQKEQQFQEQLAMAQLDKIVAEADEIKSRIKQNSVETELLPVEEETRRMAVIAKTDTTSEDKDREFNRKYKIAQLTNQERQLDIQEANMLTNLERSK
jgi:hypothetical protein